MKWNTTDFPRRAQHPLLLAAGSLPLAVLLVMPNAPHTLMRTLLFPLCYVLLAWACILLPGKRRLLAGLAGAALLIMLGLALLPAAEAPVLMLLPVMYAALLIVILPVGGWPRGQEMPVGWPAGGMLAHVAAQIAVNLTRRDGTLLYEPAADLLLWAFVLFAALVVMALNRASLDSAAQSRRSVPLLMQRQNLLLTLTLLALAVLLAAIPALGRALDRLWNLALQGIALVAALLASLLPASEGGGSVPAAPAEASFGLEEAQAPSQLALILEKIIGWAALAILIVALFFAGRALLKKLLRLLKFLWGRMGQYAARAGEDYEDEVTSTLDEPDTDREGLLGRLRRIAPEGGQDQSPTQQIRSRYKRLKRRHRAWGSASTARETLPESAAALYERARYSDHPIAPADAEAFRDHTRKL